jgi:hypothetical protein
VSVYPGEPRRGLTPEQEKEMSDTRKPETSNDAAALMLLLKSAQAREALYEEEIESLRTMLRRCAEKYRELERSHLERHPDGQAVYLDGTVGPCVFCLKAQSYAALAAEIEEMLK